MKDPMVYITTMQKDGKHCAVRMKWYGDEHGYMPGNYGELLDTPEQAVAYAQDWAGKRNEPYIAAD